MAYILDIPRTSSEKIDSDHDKKTLSTSSKVSDSLRPLDSPGFTNPSKHLGSNTTFGAVQASTPDSGFSSTPNKLGGKSLLHTIKLGKDMAGQAKTIGYSGYPREVEVLDPVGQTKQQLNYRYDLPNQISQTEINDTTKEDSSQYRIDVPKFDNFRADAESEKSYATNNCSKSFAFVSVDKGKSPPGLNQEILGQKCVFPTQLLNRPGQNTGFKGFVQLYQNHAFLKHCFRRGFEKQGSKKENAACLPKQVTAYEIMGDNRTADLSRHKGAADSINSLRNIGSRSLLSSTFPVGDQHKIPSASITETKRVEADDETSSRAFRFDEMVSRTSEATTLDLMCDKLPKSQFIDSRRPRNR